MRTILLLILCNSALIHLSVNAQVIAIKNVSVIPMDKELVLPNQTILIKDGKIVTMGPAHDIVIPTNATTLNGNGKFLLPGLFDMHAHFFNEQGNHENTCATELKLMLANGLTQVRILAGHPNYLEARQQVKDGKWIGPDLVVASPQFVGRWPWPADFKNFEIADTPENARAAVRRFKAAGYDLIKITFMVNREVYDAIVAEAAIQGIKVAGHVGPMVKLPAALNAKQQIEHMDEFIDMLLPDTSFNHGQSVSDMNIWRKAAWATVPSLDENKITELARAVANSGIYVTPTNYFFLSSFGSVRSEASIRQKPDYAYIPAALKEERWKAREHFIKLGIPDSSLQTYTSIRKKLVFALWKAGVPLMAGSDSPEFFLVTGFSIHDELAAMVDAGLSTYAALQTATTHPARYLGVNKMKGSIKAGMDADLILLDKNPLDNIHNTRVIHAVIKKGKVYTRAQLDELLEEALVLGN